MTTTVPATAAATVIPTPDADAVADVGAVGESLALASLALARRCHAGATLWCLAPRWPTHARHLAVEFVHPVIVGKRALPARSLDGGDDPRRALRLASRPGDVLIAVGPADDPATEDLVRRSEPWGLTSIRLGAGTRPLDPRADHTVWLDGTDPAEAARDGSLVVLYHLLWELTHVALEHPGLLSPEPECAEGHCVTCSDEGTVAEVRSVQGSRATVLAGGLTEEVDVSLVGAVTVDDLVLVHAGVAITSLGAEQ